MQLLERVFRSRWVATSSWPSAMQAYCVACCAAGCGPSVVRDLARLRPRAPAGSAALAQDVLRWLHLVGGSLVRHPTCVTARLTHTCTFIAECMGIKTVDASLHWLRWLRCCSQGLLKRTQRVSLPVAHAGIAKIAACLLPQSRTAVGAGRSGPELGGPPRGLT